MNALRSDGLAEFAAGIDRMLDDSGDAPAATFSGEVHPYAERWPLRPADEIEEMAASIRARGQRQPIVLTPEGVLVDGRNRLRACELAGITPTFHVDPTLVGEDEIVAYIWDVNGDRRHLTKGQRAMLAAIQPGPTVSLSESVGVALGYIGKARQVLQWCDDAVADLVISGDLALNDAYAQAQEIKATAQAEEIAAKKAAKEAEAKAQRDANLLADLRSNRPDLADLVAEGRLPLDDARTVRRQDLAKEEKRAAAKAAAIASRNADINAAFASIADLAHNEILTEVIDNWKPLVHDWTPDEIADLGRLLIEVAPSWRTA